MVGDSDNWLIRRAQPRHPLGNREETTQPVQTPVNFEPPLPAPRSETHVNGLPNVRDSTILVSTARRDTSLDDYLCEWVAELSLKEERREDHGHRSDARAKEARKHTLSNFHTLTGRHASEDEVMLVVENGPRIRKALKHRRHRKVMDLGMRRNNYVSAKDYVVEKNPGPVFDAVRNIMKKMGKRRRRVCRKDAPLWTRLELLRAGVEPNPGPSLTCRFENQRMERGYVSKGTVVCPDCHLRLKRESRGYFHPIINDYSKMSFGPNEGYVGPADVLTDLQTLLDQQAQQKKLPFTLPDEAGKTRDDCAASSSAQTGPKPARISLTIHRPSPAERKPVTAAESAEYRKSNVGSPEVPTSKIQDDAVRAQAEKRSVEEQTSLRGRCYICRSEGHIWSECPEMAHRCTHCGNVGHHVTRCQAFLYCSTCMSTSHHTKDCPYNAPEVLCSYCGSSTHTVTDCQELSRCGCCMGIGHEASRCPDHGAEFQARNANPATLPRGDAPRVETALLCRVLWVIICAACSCVPHHWFDSSLTGVPEMDILAECAFWAFWGFSVLNVPSNFEALYNFFSGLHLADVTTYLNDDGQHEQVPTTDEPEPGTPSPVDNEKKMMPLRGLTLEDEDIQGVMKSVFPHVSGVHEEKCELLYLAERRIAQNRNVQEIKATMHVRRIRALQLHSSFYICLVATLVVSLSLAGWCFSSEHFAPATPDIKPYDSIAHQAMAWFATTPLVNNWRTGIASTAEAPFIEFGRSKELFGISELHPIHHACPPMLLLLHINLCLCLWFSTLMFHSRRPVALCYVPHAVTAVLHELGRVNSETIDINIDSAIKRFACLPIPDADHTLLVEGTRAVCKYLAQKGPFFAGEAVTF